MPLNSIGMSDSLAFASTPPCDEQTSGGPVERLLLERRGCNVDKKSKSENYKQVQLKLLTNF